VNLQTERFDLIVDWNTTEINWEGRGADRGLRGIAFYNEMIIAAASDEIFFYDQQFNIIDSFTNPYLKHCHEICVYNDKLYLSSTGFDSILVFDLTNKVFEEAFCCRVVNSIFSNQHKLGRGIRKVLTPPLSKFRYSPINSNGPWPEDTLHINNVFVQDGEIYFSGRFLDRLYKINKNKEFQVVSKIPRGTHNVQFFDAGILMNNTSSDNILYMDLSGEVTQTYEILKYEQNQLNDEGIPQDHARQGFGRGLCTFGDFIVAGSSPATISVYRKGHPIPVKSVNLTMDIRNSIHGLEVYPFELSARTASLCLPLSHNNKLN